MNNSKQTNFYDLIDIYSKIEKDPIKSNNLNKLSKRLEDGTIIIVNQSEIEKYLDAKNLNGKYLRNKDEIMLVVGSIKDINYDDFIKSTIKINLNLDKHQKENNNYKVLVKSSK